MHIFIIQLEWRRFGLVQDFYAVSEDFNLTRRHVRIYSAFRTITNLAGNADNEFISNGIGDGKGICTIRIKDVVRNVLRG